MILDLLSPTNILKCHCQFFKGNLLFFFTQGLSDYVSLVSIKISVYTKLAGLTSPKSTFLCLLMVLKVCTTIPQDATLA